MPVLAIDIGWGPNLFEIWGLLLTWHGVFTAVGILAGVQLSLRMAEITGYDYDDAYALALVGVPCGVIGARLLYVAEAWDYYGSNPGDIIRITEGGISIWGAILGGLAGALVFGLWRGYPVARGLDIAAFGMILGQGIGRLGDLVNGEHLATATDLAWGVIYTHPDYSKHKDLRRARAAGLNIVPTSTGAASAVSKIMPDLDGKLTGLAYRVPTPTVSVVDLATDLAQSASVGEINEAFQSAAAGDLEGVLYVERDELVSTDFKSHPGSSIFDLPATMAVDGGRMVKTMAWYDNEYGYACRLADVCALIAERGLE